MIRPLLLVVSAALLLEGCLNIQAADLFVLTRTGQGHALTLLVSDSGTITCNGKQHSLPDSLLLQARDLVGSLRADAQAHLRIPAPASSVFHYRVRLQYGTITFPDTAAATHPVLARVELFAVQAAAQACGLS